VYVAPTGAGAMKNRLYWIALGGLFFWVPVVVADHAFPQIETLWVLTATPLAGLMLLVAATWLCTKKLPKWGWCLAGIYILGPACMLVLGLLFHNHFSPDGLATSIDLKPALLLTALCLFPPTTLWFSMLNGTFFAVLIASSILPFLVVFGQRG
jgi:hypothetical protein